MVTRAALDRKSPGSSPGRAGKKYPPLGGIFFLSVIGLEKLCSIWLESGSPRRGGDGDPRKGTGHHSCSSPLGKFFYCLATDSNHCFTLVESVKSPEGDRPLCGKRLIESGLREPGLFSFCASFSDVLLSPNLFLTNTSISAIMILRISINKCGILITRDNFGEIV